MKELWKNQRIAVVGATGIVGKELLFLLQEKQICSLFLYARKKKALRIKDTTYSVEALEDASFKDIDFVFLCAGSCISEKLWNHFPSDLCVIDLSSKYRLDPKVPLVLPEVNRELLRSFPNKITSPNCIVSLLLPVLYPLYQKFPVKKLVLSTYQAASGGGQKLLQTLLQETREFYEGKTPSKPYAFSLYPHNSHLLENGQVEEEAKIQAEVRKILQNPTLEISVNAVRVPVIRAHSISLHIEFEKEAPLSEVRSLLENAEGVFLWEENQDPLLMTPFEVSNKSLIFCGRLRKSCKNSLDLWIVGDQLLKGAALNALQIAENLLILRNSHVLEEKNA